MGSEKEKKAITIRFFIIILVFISCIKSNDQQTENEFKISGYKNKKTVAEMKRYLFQYLEKTPNLSAFQKSDAYQKIGDLYFFEDKYNEAFKYNLKAIELNTNNYFAYFSLGSIYFKQKNYAMAILYFKKQEELKIIDGNVYYFLAHCYFLIDDYKKSNLYIEKYQRFDLKSKNLPDKEILAQDRESKLRILNNLKNKMGQQSINI